MQCSLNKENTVWKAFGEWCKGPVIPFGSMVEYHRNSARDQARLHQCVKKVLLGIFLGYALCAGGIWKGHVLVADLEELETMDASEIYSKRLNATEVIFPTKKREFIFPIEDGRIKPLGGDQDLRTSTLIRQRPFQAESHLDFLGESEGSLSPPHDSFPDPSEAINDFWSMSGSFMYRHHVEPRVKLHSPREESFTTPLKYIDVSRTTHTNLDVKQEKRIDDYWNVDGSRDLSDPWTGFTQFTLLEEKPPDGYMWSGGRLTRKQQTSRPDHLWPELWKSMGKHAKLKEKQKWSNEKLLLENARKLRAIYFIDPEDKEFKETIKNARKKLETSVAPAMPCKIMKNCGNDGSNKIKIKLACILEADESTRLRMGNSVPNYHGKETCWSKTFEELENLDASEVHARRLNAKEIITPKNGENRSCCVQWCSISTRCVCLHHDSLKEIVSEYWSKKRRRKNLQIFSWFFQATDVPALMRCHFVDTEPRRLRLESHPKQKIADGRSKLCGGNHGIRNSTSMRDQLVRGKKLSVDLRGCSDKSQPIDEIVDVGEARNDFWSIEGNYIYRHHVEPRVRKEHSQYHCDTWTWSGQHTRPWMCCKKAVLMITGTWMRIETYRNHGRVSRSMSKADERKEKQQWAIE